MKMKSTVIAVSTLKKIDREKFFDECYKRSSEKNKFIKVDLDELR